MHVCVYLWLKERREIKIKSFFERQPSDDNSYQTSLFEQLYPYEGVSAQARADFEFLTHGCIDYFVKNIWSYWT